MNFRFALIAALGVAVVVPAAANGQPSSGDFHFQIGEAILTNPKPGHFVVTRYANLQTSIGMPGLGACGTFKETMDSTDADLTKTEELLKEKLIKNVNACVEQVSKAARELK